MNTMLDRTRTTLALGIAVVVVAPDRHGEARDADGAGRRSDGASEREGKMRKLIVGLAPFLAALIFASSAAAYETSAKLSEVANVYSLGVGEVRCASETEWNADDSE
jgi:hypothetical protein